MISALFLAMWRSLKEPSHLKRLADRFGFGPVGTTYYSLTYLLQDLRLVKGFLEITLK